MEAKAKKNLESFFEKHRLIKLRRNELVFQPGDEIESSYYLKSGYLRIFSICKTGQEVTISILKPHTFLSLFFGQEKTKSRYFVEALTAAEVYQAPQKEVIEFMLENPDFFSEMLGQVNNLNKELLLRIENLASGNAYTKVVAVLLLLAGNTSTKKTTGISLDFVATHRTIASMTGLTRETVTLQMLKLKKNGLISGKGRRLVINDLTQLKEELPCPFEEN